MSVSKELVGNWPNMAVEGNTALSLDAFSRHRGIWNPSKITDFPACEKKKPSSWSSYPRIISLVCLLVAFLYLTFHDAHLGLLVRRRESDQLVVLPAVSNGVLEVFQVNAPVAVGGGECTVLLMEHSFGFSYGKPFVGMYHLSMGSKSD